MSKRKAEENLERSTEPTEHKKSKISTLSRKTTSSSNDMDIDEAANGDQTDASKKDVNGTQIVEEKVTETASEETPENAKPVIDLQQPRLTDVLLIEHAVKNLQSSIDSIIQSAPDEAGLEQMQNSVTEETNQQLTAALSRYKVRLAAKLKTMYNNKELELFDQILQFEKLSDAIQVPKAMDCSPQFAPQEANTSSSSSAGDKSEKQEPTESSFPHAKKGLPPIPEIRDPAIRARVFIHKSLIKDKLFLSKKEQLHSHNERLEFLGDSVLNNIMTQIAYNRFPEATEGQLSVIRTKLICNATLMRWSADYGLDVELKKDTPIDSLHAGKMKLYADVFEAYIGGLMTESSSNFSAVYEWLKELAEPILKENEPKQENRSQFRPNAKMELYSLIGSASLGLRYQCTFRQTYTVPQRFVVELRTRDDDLLGVGEGENIKVAGVRAAMQALDNKELIEKYSLLRANTPRDTSKLPVNGVKSDSKDSVNPPNPGDVPPPPPPPPPPPSEPAPTSKSNDKKNESSQGRREYRGNSFGHKTPGPRDARGKNNHHKDRLQNKHNRGYDNNRHRNGDRF